MQTLQSQGTRSCRWYPAVEDDADTGWAHVSGWAQLNGTRRSVSCVVPAHNALGDLRSLLPVLSDALTECGFPWEIIVIDCASNDGTENAMRRWCELPGYRLIALDEPADRAAAIALGLSASRGDAVVLLDAASKRDLLVLSDLVMRWEAGSAIVVAAVGARPMNTFVHEAASLEEAFDAAEGQIGDSENLVLLDRTVVRDLLG